MTPNKEPKAIPAAALRSGIVRRCGDIRDNAVFEWSHFAYLLR
jgi:hypothetical protein